MGHRQVCPAAGFHMIHTDDPHKTVGLLVGGCAWQLASTEYRIQSRQLIYVRVYPYTEKSRRCNVSQVIKLNINSDKSHSQHLL